jgi:hypothetical protein
LRLFIFLNDFNVRPRAFFISGLFIPDESARDPLACLLTWQTVLYIGGGGSGESRNSSALEHKRHFAKHAAAAAVFLLTSY